MTDQPSENKAGTLPEEKKETPKDETPAPSQNDPVKAELDRVNQGKTRTEAEKAAYALKKNAERARELGLDPLEVLGAKAPDEPLEEDDTPVTVGMLKSLELDKAQKTSIALADEIQDANERELVKHHLETTIRPSGNPTEDLKAARAIVNSVKHGQIAEELARKNPPRSSSFTPGAPPKVDPDFTPTAEEDAFIKSGMLTKEDVIAARKKIQDAQAGQQG